MFGSSIQLTDAAAMCALRCLSLSALGIVGKSDYKVYGDKKEEYDKKNTCMRDERVSACRV